jgi:hypothetical protein
MSAADLRKASAARVLQVAVKTLQQIAGGKKIA